MKAWHDKYVIRKEFKASQQVLLFNSRLKIFPGKLKSRWSGPFMVTQVFPHGGAKIMHLEKRTFKVNTQRLKPYFGSKIHVNKQTIPLSVPEVLSLALNIVTLTRRDIEGPQKNHAFFTSRCWIPTSRRWLSLFWPPPGTSRCWI